jgi:hypothetical protein
VLYTSSEGKEIECDVNILGKYILRKKGKTGKRKPIRQGLIWQQRSTQ